MSQSHTILIIEDENLILNTLADKLTLEGFTIIKARNGQEGLQKALEYKPHLILMDLVMPIMDGITMLKNAQKEPEIQNIPIMVLTNLADEETAREVMTYGCTDYLRKTDHSLEDLVNKIRARL